MPDPSDEAPKNQAGGEKPESKAPDQLRPGDEAEHRRTVTRAAAGRDERMRTRPDEIRVDMMRSVITEPLLSRVQEKVEQGDDAATFDVIVALNETFQGGMTEALKYIRKRADEWGVRYTTISHYCFASLTVRQILTLSEEARRLQAEKGRRASVVYRIWEDTDVDVTLTRSLTTIKADAAHRAFHANGSGIVWAVLDSGVQGDHPHFAPKDTPFGHIEPLREDPPVCHMDFTADGRSAPAAATPASTSPPSASPASTSPTSAPPTSAPSTSTSPTSASPTALPPVNTALLDRFGHGTHVAGIIAGYWHSTNPKGDMVAGTEIRDEQTNEPVRHRERIQRISGVAPMCRIVSLKVIADVTQTGAARQTAGQGKVSWVLMALDQVQQWNQYGKRLLIHGVNMSLGYEFDPRWFACGQSPICVEVDRLVKSGVSVVVSAGNSGYSAFVLASGRSEARFNDLTITDPGNAELAITVGSTHKEMPHTYGVSYFSSRGPTGDGRSKPDLLAPGERIVSCAAGLEARKYEGVPDATTPNPSPVLYCEQTGTSMAAPHVSGAIAAFLSVRTEFVGQPERVKDVFLSNCIDLRRDKSFQGSGLLDLMKVLQAV